MDNKELTPQRQPQEVATAREFLEKLRQLNETYLSALTGEAVIIQMGSDNCMICKGQCQNPRTLEESLLDLIDKLANQSGGIPGGIPTPEWIDFYKKGDWLQAARLMHLRLTQRHQERWAEVISTLSTTKVEDTVEDIIEKDKSGQPGPSRILRKRSHVECSGDSA